jgi:uncharacterized protein (TIGR03435 family)
VLARKDGRLGPRLVRSNVDCAAWLAEKRHRDLDAIWTPDESLAPAGTRPDVGVSLFAALEEQLGLRLEPTRRPFQVRVVQRVERPLPD